jgi:predicted kinase
MDKVSPSKPTLIIVIGLPGSGKSFFAQQFAKSFGAALVSEDKIRYLLFAHHTYNESENSIIRQVANMMIKELLKTKKTFILDGGYNDGQLRSSLVNIAKKAAYQILTIVVQTDTKTAERRATHRSGKKAGDRYKQSLSPEEFAVQAKIYQAPPPLDKTVVVISGKHTYSTQARFVLKKMLEMRNLTPAEPQSTPIVRSRGLFIQ